MIEIVGDVTQEPEMIITTLNGNVAVPLASEDPVPLIFPPQGGRVLFVGVQVRNVNVCGARLVGALRDLTTSQLRLDARTVNLIPTANGWAETDPTDYSSFSNIPACPNQWSATDLYNAAYQLEVVLTDRSGRKVGKKLVVTPTCAEPELEAECRCICAAGYTLGQPCNLDGGIAGDGG